MHITDKLNQALKERDEAQARYEQAMADHREAYPWLIIDEKPTDDMTDPANWRAGDWLECVRDHTGDASRLTIGGVYTVIYFGREGGAQPGWPGVTDDYGDIFSWPTHYFRFHSRP